LRVGALTQRLTVERLHQIKRGGNIQRKDSRAGCEISIEDSTTA
jgi:hypothetical protein